MSVVPQYKKITEEQKVSLAISSNIEIPMLKAFFAVESAGIGFSDYTGRILIQFEPQWFAYYLGEGVEKGSIWLANGVGNQTEEYKAFEDAARINRSAAMKSTSIGIGQVMGFHYSRLGFNSVFEMWEYAEQNEFNQASLVTTFLKTDPILFRAVQQLNMPVIAEKYNGAGYKELAKRLRIVPYDIQLQRAYNKFKEDCPIHHTTTTVNIRKGAGIDFSVAAKPLRINTPVIVLQYQNGWTKVEVVATGLKGWIKSEFIK